MQLRWMKLLRQLKICKLFKRPREEKDLLDGMLRASADLDPDGDGTCDHISATLEFDATPAFLYE